ncbi:RHS repeat-associated core domain-containing protein [Streptomyces sp. 2231.1]|uniref:RHS repeat-associated core domain-containing protein n=1 Tax=Streptomyces sp. 2231.1 TaxID=1855347 RepID=UPI000894C053|nr:RHS repeat-associated core domain-containing protein [Streptomyces sp. 2231.1]SED49807.1 RHS repeat-associated core domain-containing protein [Streptomyces sp. 2231.1]
MGYVLPGWLDEILDFIGINFPNVDEDDYREMADAMRDFADKFEGHGADAHKAVERILSSSQGWAVDSMEKHWSHVKTGHLDKIPELARLFADACDVVADVIFGMKTKAEAELAIMAGSVGLSIGLSFVTGGLSAVLGAAETAAMRKLVKRIIDEAVDRIVDELIARVTAPVNAKLEAMVEDVVLDLANDAFSLPPDPAGAGGGEGGPAGHGHGHNGMQLASAGGAGSGFVLASAGGGAGADLFIDHDEFESGAGKVSSHGSELHLASSSPLGRAKGAFGRTKGKDPFTNAFDSVLEGALHGSEKALKKITRHVTDTVPDRVKAASRTHKQNDLDIRSKLDGLSLGKGRGKGGGGHGRPGVDGGSGHDPAELSKQGRAMQNRQLCGDPIDMATGQMVMVQTDVDLAGVLPLTLRRTHVTRYDGGRFFGPSWCSTLDERLEDKSSASGGVWWYREDGSILVYPRLPDLVGDRVQPVEGERLPLTYVTDGTAYVLTVQDPLTGLRRFFEPSPAGDGVWWLTGVEDRNHNALTIERADDDIPTAVTHTGGYRVRIDADPAHRRVTALHLLTDDGPVRLRCFAYDDAGDLVETRDGMDAQLHLTYDAEHRITGWRDAQDTVFSYTYDDRGRVVATQGSDGILDSRIDYGDPDADGATTVTYTDSLGHPTVYRANWRGQVVAVTDPLGNTVTQRWDRYDRLVSRTDAAGGTTVWTWDEHGNLVAVQEADGTVTTAEYDEHGMPVVMTGPDGAVWRCAYDQAGNHTELMAPDGTVTRYTHDERGAVTAITDALGATETFRPDAAGLPMSRTDALGRTWTFTRDGFRRPTSITDPLGAVTSLEWDAEGRLVRRTEPDGTRRSWSYDGEGNRLTETDANGGTTHYRYTHFGLLAARTQPGGARYVFAYDTEMRLTEVRNSAGQSWTYAYDAAGQVVRETDFDGRSLTYTHDLGGRSIARVNPLGQTVTQHYDALGRLAEKDVDGTVTSFSYDPMGRLLRATSPHSAMELEWDGQGRLTAETVDGRTHRYAYDAVGRRTSRTTPGGTVTTQTYDAAGNRTRMELAGRPLRFTYDVVGQELTRTFGPPDRAVTLATSWDTLGRVSEQHLGVGGHTVRARAYTYRPDHHILAVTDRPSGETKRFTLDPDGRPTGVDAGNWSERYLYDAEGNQTDAAWPDRAPHADARGPRSYEGTRLNAAGSLHYTYDAAGRVVERRRKRLSRKPEVWRYTWDAEDRLTSCTTPDGVLWTYGYDAFARRTAKRRHAPDGTIVEETVFSWDGGRLSEQTDSTTRTTLTWEYDGFRPLAQTESRQAGDELSDIDSRFFAIVTDVIGTPTELVGEDGDIAWRSRAGQWGATAWNRDATAYTPLRFPGQYADQETGLHYNHFRHYDPEPGRYITPDPLGLDPAPNPVGYVDNPATMSDPMGLAPCMQAMEDMAVQINNLKPTAIQREKQTVAIIHAQTPKGPVTFVAGTSKSKLDAQQIALAKSLGLVPIPNDAYMKVPPKVKGGHAEQNILAYMSRLNAGKEKPDWLPTHGAASNSVCTKFCSPLIRGSNGAMYGLVHSGTQGTQQKQFYWPARHTPG